MAAILKGTGQVILLWLFSLLMNGLVDWFHIKIPGSIVGMIVLFLLLQTNIIRLDWIEAGATWLLAELLLFFVPSAVGIMKYQHMLLNDGVRVLFVIILSTALVMACTGLSAAKIAKRKEQNHS
ncbi:CidA/LrgA family holin-like protein [Aneurinibacillus sp. BA2021]|nr:CidA/LrgA family holin-like protein [Aneurinibacillus sp. BA2021]